MRASTQTIPPPWNLKLVEGPLVGPRVPLMREDRDIDLDYHVRHSALPHPGGQRELGILVSRLHSHQLDLHRPLWEAHLIEGLEGNRFAIYMKMHHSLIDGVSGMRMILRDALDRSRRARTCPRSGPSRPASARRRGGGRRRAGRPRGRGRARRRASGRRARPRRGRPRPRRGRRPRAAGALPGARLGARRPARRPAPLRHPAVRARADQGARQRRRLHAQRRRPLPQRHRPAPLPERARAACPTAR